MVVRGAKNLKNYKEWFNAIESKLKSTRATGSDVAVVLNPMLNIAKKDTSTRWAFNVKFDRNFKERQVVLGWRQKHRTGCETTLFVCRFDSLVIAFAKTVKIPEFKLS